MTNNIIKKIIRRLTGRQADQFLAKRDRIMREYIKGSGLEIGALHNPLQLPQGAFARYVDRMSVDDLRKQYPELSGRKLVNVDIIADGELLRPVENCSQDFVIANHFIEHCQNPILAIENMLRVLKAGGILFLAIPDKRFTFDNARKVTSYEHLFKDYTEGAAQSRGEHFTEWAEKVDKVPVAELAEKARHLMDIDYSIHFHAWTQTGIIEFLLKLQDMFAFEIEMICRNAGEIIVILRKI